MKIVGTLRIYTFVNDEVLATFFRNEGVVTVRTEQTNEGRDKQTFWAWGAVGFPPADRWVLIAPKGLAFGGDMKKGAQAKLGERPRSKEGPDTLSDAASPRFALLILFSL